MQTVAIFPEKCGKRKWSFSKNLIWLKCKPNKLNVLKLNLSILSFSPSRRPGTLLVFSKFAENCQSYSIQRIIRLTYISKRKSVIIYMDICNMQVTCCCKYKAFSILP